MNKEELKQKMYYDLKHIEMLERSIENGWTGVFEINGKEQKPSMESELERQGYVRR